MNNLPYHGAYSGKDGIVYMSVSPELIEEPVRATGLNFGMYEVPEASKQQPRSSCCDGASHREATSSS